MRQDNRLYAATIGFFDGVHRGHSFVIDQLRQAALERDLGTMIVTFNRQPRQVLQPEWKPQLLTTTDEKVALLKSAGIDRVEVVDFTPEMARMTAPTFMGHVLADRLGVGMLLMGYDNRFGHRREETSDDYVAYGRQVGIEVLRARRWQTEGLVPCSSRVRQLVADGQMAEAADMMGHPYTLSGPVVHGQRIGHRIGFPTANLQPDSTEKIVPRRGVYAVTAQIDDSGSRFRGMMNIGTRPTFDGQQTTLETHLFDFDGDLYGRRLTISFVARLRDEQAFPDPTALTAQMAVDRRQAIAILENKHNRKQK